MARVFTVTSGSNGNCAYVGDAVSGVLIDAGQSFLKMKSELDKLGMDFKNIEALLVTHEHSDHIKGIETFCKKTDIPVFANKQTAAELMARFPAVQKNLHIMNENEQINLKRTAFCAFNVFHDSACAVGYRVFTADSRQVVLSTDTGHIDDELFQNISNADLNIIEANYDEGMLSCNVSYPFLLRKRIAGDFGHLSNSDCAQTVLKLIENGGRRFVLAHLSEHNNTPQIAFETVKSELSKNGYQFGVDYEMTVAPRYDLSEMLVF